MLPKSKIAVVQVARRETRMGEDDFRQLLRDYGGVESTTELDQRGFEAVMDRFRTLGFISRRVREGIGTGRPGMATDAQIGLIRDLWKEAAVVPSDRNLARWLEKYFGTSAVRFLTFRKAHRVIGAMRAMIARKAAQDA